MKFSSKHVYILHSIQLLALHFTFNTSIFGSLGLQSLLRNNMKKYKIENNVFEI